MKKPLFSLHVHIFPANTPSVHKAHPLSSLGCLIVPQTWGGGGEATKAPDIRRHRKPTRLCHPAASLSLRKKNKKTSEILSPSAKAEEGLSVGCFRRMNLIKSLVCLTHHKPQHQSIKGLHPAPHELVKSLHP